MQYEIMASSKARAERLKKLRKMAKIPRRKLAESHNISAGTIPVSYTHLTLPTILLV